MKTEQIYIKNYIYFLLDNKVYAKFDRENLSTIKVCSKSQADKLQAEINTGINESLTEKGVIIYK